jgi:hypothetical protein
MADLNRPREAISASANDSLPPDRPPPVAARFGGVHLCALGNSAGARSSIASRRERCSHWRCAMGDRGRKKDKDKNQRQRTEKHDQKTQVRLDKAKPSVSSPVKGAAVRSTTGSRPA